MARITKAKQKILGLNAPSDQMAAFGSCKTGVPVYTTDINALQTAAYEQGWQDATDNDFAPYREEMNGVQYGLSRQIAYLQQEGLGEWIDTVTYYKGSVVKVLTSDSQVWYESTEDENTGNDPTVEGSTHWKELKFGGSGLELCDIGMALYVDETKGLRRYLNGQIVDINTNTQAFLNRLLEIKNTNPELFTTESNWQSEATLNIDGCVYKFVLNYSGDNVVSVRLPKYPDYVEINAGGTLPVVGNGMTLGWTDGKGNYRGTVEIRDGGLTVNSTYGSNLPLTGQSANNFPNNPLVGITSDPTKSGIETTLKQTKLKMRYFIQIATGSETENNIINDIELNNPYSLFDSKYSDHELNNLSWLKSEGQWNAKAAYTDAYDKLLKVQNGTETVEGLSVKLSTETYTDYDFVLNTADETFRLPLLDGSEDIMSDRYDDLELKASGSTYTAPANGWFWISVNSSAANQYINLGNLISGYTQNYSVSSTDTMNLMRPVRKNEIVYVYYSTGGAVNHFKFIYAQGNGSLYFYVGETVQNANLIDAGRIGEQLATKTDMLQASGAGMPSNKYIDLTLGASGSTYTAPANGWIYISKRAGIQDAHCGLLNTTKNIGTIFHVPQTNNICRGYLPVSKNDIFSVTYSATETTSVFRFIYAEGEV